MLEINCNKVNPLLMSCYEHVVMALVKDEKKRETYKSETMLFMGSSFRERSYGYARINQVVYNFGWFFAMIMDIPEITLDNIDMVYKRINLFERVKSTMFINCRVTRDDVKALVGLKVNARLGTKSQFITKLNYDSKNKRGDRVLLYRAYDDPTHFVSKGSSYGRAENEGVVKSYMMNREENKDHMFSSRKEAEVVLKELV